MNASQEAIARLIERLDHSDRGPVDELFALVYDELKTLAHRQRRRWRGQQTMNTTALVHEVYVKLVGQARVSAESRPHFQALAARAMRHVLSNYARGQNTEKRGGGGARVAIDVHDVDPAQPSVDRVDDRFAELAEALTALERDHPRAARVVECRFFGGMSVAETAVAVGASERSVKRDWSLAQAWLHRALDGPAIASQPDSAVE